ncbi:hypothetical protein ASF23_08480 [Curtobacterium sp. Leaf261]|nr:hypothetical protein ASF23_08480 [Curtobacterium sp. Leaf261]
MHFPGSVEAAPTSVASPAAVGTSDRTHDDLQRASEQGGSVARSDDPDHVGALHGEALLDALTDLSAPDLRRAVADGSRVQTTVLDDPPTASETASWWSTLTRVDQERLVDVAPQVVGSLEGVPYDVRDVANRTYLARAAKRIDSDGAAETSESAMIGQIQVSLADTAPGDPRKELLTVDLRGTGRASIAIGDLDTARDVTVLVPGMFFTVTGQLHDWTDTGVDLYREQATLTPAADALVARTVSTTGAVGSAAGVPTVGQGSGVAVIAWMGYRTPDLSNVMSLSLAHEGAPRLERVISGLDLMRADHAPRVSIVAHSYGSTTSLMALATGRIHVDSLTVIGSPGSTIAHSSSLAVPTGQVFVGNAHWDPIAGTGYFGTDPGSKSFGATVLDLDGGADPVDADDVFRQPRGHNDYLKAGTASLHDIALIAIGRSDLIQAGTSGDGPDGRDGSGSPQFLVVRPQDLALRD